MAGLLTKLDRTISQYAVVHQPPNQDNGHVSKILLYDAGLLLLFHAADEPPGAFSLVNIAEKAVRLLELRLLPCFPYRTLSADSGDPRKRDPPPRLIATSPWSEFSTATLSGHMIPRRPRLA